MPETASGPFLNWRTRPSASIPSLGWAEWSRPASPESIGPPFAICPFRGFDSGHHQWLNLSNIQLMEYHDPCDNSNHQEPVRGEPQPGPGDVVASAASGLLAAPPVDVGDPRVRPGAPPLDRASNAR